MIILLTNIEFNVFKALPNKQEYIKNSNFFYLQKVYDKSDVISILDTVVWWYSIWEKTPLYVTVVTDRSWNKLVKGLKFKHKIEISKTIPDELDNESQQRMILEDDRISETACKETIIHELLHTCKGCMRHTGKWKYYAEVVNQVYGYNIKRVTEGSEKGIENYESKEMNVKYVFTCGNCGATIYRKRDSKFTRYYRYYDR
jgi:hypothetical protein